MVFDLQIERIEDWVRDRGLSSVAIQLPEGLKVRATEISGRIHSDTGADVVVLGDPCYGACDIFSDYKTYAQGLVHFGHSRMPSLPDDPDIMFVEARSDVHVKQYVEDLAHDLPDRVGLLASVQYVHLLGEAREALEAAGKTVLIGTGDDRIMYPGQVLGCDFSCGSSIEKDVDCFLFIGEGDFHPLAAAFGVEKEVVILNPVTGERRSVDDVRDRILRKRFAQIESARSARSFMVIVSTKPGQRRLEAAERVERMLREDGREVHRLVASEISPQALLPYRVDAFVNTACPRVALDDSARYGKPMLTVPEAEIVAGRRTWDEYVFDTFRRARVIPYIGQFDGRKHAHV